jgi:probable F420-dependent oxidoreductase
MKFGVVFPTHDVGDDPGAIREFAVGVEELGFDHLVTYDHVLGAPHDGREPPLTGPYDEHDEFHEPFVLFGHLAALTRRIELVVGVLVAPQRQIALVAKQAAEVQVLSQGRLRVGLGTGWNHVEYEALGADFDRRGEVLDEQVSLLRRFWTEPLVTFDGSFHHVDRAGILPLPDPPIPLWFGGYSSAAFGRSARLGDGHLFGHLRPATLDHAAELRSLLVRNGRDPETFGLEAITDAIADPDRWAAAGATWRAAGGTHLSVRTMRTAGLPVPGHRTVSDHLATIERWRDAMRAAGEWPR